MKEYSFCEIVELLTFEHDLKFQTSKYIVEIKNEHLVFTNKETKEKEYCVTTYDLQAVYTEYKKVILKYRG